MDLNRGLPPPKIPQPLIMPRSAYDTTGTPKPKNGLSQKSTPHDAQANHPKRVWWSEKAPPSLNHSETPVNQTHVSQANCGYDLEQETGHHDVPE